MSVGDIRQIWSMSAAIYPGQQLSNLLFRCKFVCRSALFYGALKPLLRAKQDTVLGRLLKERPETIGAVIWPYQCASWDAPKRLKQLIKHCNAAARLGRPIDLGPRDRVVLADLGYIRSDLRVLLDQPSWFMREGNLVINLFVGRVRLYSLAFSLSEENDGVLSAVVGAIQGRDIDGILEEYKKLTKLAHGIRPRDLLLECFCMLCQLLNVKKAIAVSDEARHHRHNYFGQYTETRKAGANYNDIWEDRGASRLDLDFYLLDIAKNRRDLNDVPAKKRGMYRRRYRMLEGIKCQISERLLTAKTLPKYEPEQSYDL